MSSAIKTIENPEVPGLECLLPPPPPPPPPPPIISTTGIKELGTILTPPGLEKTKEAQIIAQTPFSSSAVKTKIASEDCSDTNKFPNARIAGIAAKVANTTGISVENVAQPGTVQNAPLFPETAPVPYFLQAAVPQINQVPVGDQPWWVPTDSDSTEGKSVGSTWLEKNMTWSIDSIQKTTSPTSKAKTKFFKRKSECIDPAQDAERVANAQRELSALMKPLNCDLCNAIMNSTLQAKLHYEGKPHQKKVSMFLNQSVKKVKSDDVQVTSTTCSTDWNTYCDVCKTWFTSQIDASQHYAGKKHIRATTGGTRQKTKKPANQAPVDPTGRFGIGVPFTSETPPATTSTEIAVVPPVVPPVIPPITPSATAYQTPTVWSLPAFRCELCGVTANRLEQLETHKRGAKHMRMLKMNGLVNSDVDENKDSSAQSNPSSIDYSIYRTPSGHYYCAPCNRSFHSENSFAQHVESKKHKTQVNPKQVTPSVPVVSKKANKSAK